MLTLNQILAATRLSQQTECRRRPQKLILPKGYFEDKAFAQSLEAEGKYASQWIAVRDQELVAVGDSRKEVRMKVKAKGIDDAFYQFMDDGSVEYTS